MSHCLRPRQIINPHFNPKTTLGAKNLRVWRVANNSPQGYPEDYQILIDCGKCLGCLRIKPALGVSVCFMSTCLATMIPARV